MEHLIDGDFASNNGGWGFAASTGVDPQPYFRVFNPPQSEKFDEQGEYIRKWLPELKDIKGKQYTTLMAEEQRRKPRRRDIPGQWWTTRSAGTDVLRDTRKV